MAPNTYASVFDAIADTPQEAVNLRLRAELMQRTETFIERKKWTQREAKPRAISVRKANQREVRKYETAIQNSEA